MKKHICLVLVASSILLGGCMNNAHTLGFGTLGAAGGGALGTMVGAGKGKMIATGVGTALGGIVGSMFGSTLDGVSRNTASIQDIQQQQYQALQQRQRGNQSFYFGQQQGAGYQSLNMNCSVQYNRVVCNSR